ncbi:MAG TPA: hypothetical protein VF292_07425 [Rhodanobacteraceae bacterium]
MNANQKAGRAHNAVVATENTPFGVMRVPDGGCPIEELDLETLRTMGRFMQDQELHPWRYEARSETVEQVAARVAAEKEARKA